MMSSAGQSMEQPDYYSIIAGRIVSDPAFVVKLIEYPRLALREALEAVGLNPTDDLINELAAMLNTFKGTVGEEYLARNARDYLADRPEIEMI